VRLELKPAGRERWDRAVLDGGRIVCRREGCPEHVFVLPADAPAARQYMHLPESATPPEPEAVAESDAEEAP